VVGGHGKTGRAVTAALRRRGGEVRPLGRADLRTPVEALRGCDAAYLIAPNMYADEPAFIGNLLDAVANTEVSKVVFHSVATPYAPTMPHHLGKAIAEDLVRRLPIAWTILQPGPYLQNFLPALQARPPTLDQPYDVTKPFNFVDLADVAEAAAIVTLEGRHDGATYELGGPDRASVAEVARIAGDLLGTEVTASRIDPARWAADWAADQGAGLETRVRDWLLAMFDHYDHFGLLVGSLSLEAVLGRRPTGIRAALQRDL
jgi:uncharacterized protein YbjT (DUF2867 family)